MDPAPRELIERVLADPDNDANYLVYADWLVQQGDKRGLLANIQNALCSRPTDPTLLQQEAELRDALQHELFDTLPLKLLRLNWRLGFVVGAAVDLPLDVDANLDVNGDLEPLLQHPACRFLRQLTVRVVLDYDAIPGKMTWDVTSLFEALRAARQDLLESLFLVCPWVKVVTARGSLSTGLPRLATLSLDCRFPVREILPLASRMAEIDLRFDRHRPHDLSKLLAEGWPSLRRLVLRKSDLSTLQALTPETFPLLEHLAMVDCQQTDELGPTLQQSPLRPQLTSFDLSIHKLGDSGKQWWIDNRNSFGKTVLLTGRALLTNDIDIMWKSFRSSHHSRDYSAGQAAVFLHRLGRAEQFLETLDAALPFASETSRAPLLCAKGHALQELGRNEEAVGCYDAMLAIRGDYSYLHYQRAIALRAADRHEEAVDAIDQSISLGRSDDPYPRHIKGYLCRFLGRTEAATEALEQALELYRHENANDDERYQEACILALLERVDEALPLLRSVIEHAPKYRQQALEDVDFAHIRESEAFRAVVQSKR